MCNGWIKLHRKIVDWEWYDDGNVFRLFMHFLLNANTKDCRWHGMDIKRGQLIISSEDISKKLHFTRQQYRTALNKLKSTNEITTKSTNKNTIVTICKYDSYQRCEDSNQPTEQPTEQPSSNQQTTNKQPSSNQHYNNKNNKNIRNKEDNKKEKIVKEKVVAPCVATSTTESIESRKEKFYQSLVPYVEKYGREMVRAFYDYWTELTPGGRKMRVEQQRVFEISKRLATWKKNETKYETNHDRHGESSNAAKAERDAEFFAHIREKLSRPNTDAEDLPYALQDI